MKTSIKFYNIYKTCSNAMRKFFRNIVGRWQSRKLRVELKITSLWAIKAVLPVYDSIAVQEHERRRHLGGVEAGSSLVKLPGALDLKHQVASVHVLHDEEEAVLEKWNTRWQIGKKERNPLCVKGQKSPYYQYLQARILRFTISLDILKKFCSGITF